MHSASFQFEVLSCAYHKTWILIKISYFISRNMLFTFTGSAHFQENFKSENEITSVFILSHISQITLTLIMHISSRQKVKTNEEKLYEVLIMIVMRWITINKTTGKLMKSDVIQMTFLNASDTFSACTLYTSQNTYFQHKSSYLTYICICTSLSSLILIFRL